MTRLLTRTGLDWTDKYSATAAALAGLPLQEAYIDGELCAVAPNGVTSFSLMQAAADSRRTAALVYFAFDLLYIDGENLMAEPFVARKERLQSVLDNVGHGVRYVDHQLGQGSDIYRHACRMCSKASYRSKPTRHTDLATVACGSRQNVSIERNLPS
jgi:ATP-dependent DNA ligase